MNLHKIQAQFGHLLRSLHDHACVSCWCERCLAPSVCHLVHLWLHRSSAHLSPVSPPEQPREMCDNGDPEDKPPAPPVRMSSTIFSTGSGKDSLSANHSSKPLPSVPEERKPRNKIISIFSGAEKSMKITVSQGCRHVWYQYWLHWFMISLLCKYTNIFVLSQVVGRKIGTKNGRRFRRLQTLNTPYMLALTPSRGSSLWVPSICCWSLGHQPKHILKHVGIHLSDLMLSLHRACQSNGPDFSRRQTSPSRSRRKTHRLCWMFSNFTTRQAMVGRSTSAFPPRVRLWIQFVNFPSSYLLPLVFQWIIFPWAKMGSI